MRTGPAHGAIHPGQRLRDEIKTRGIKPAQLAEDIGVPRSRVSLILNEKRAITAETALRLARYFGNVGNGAMLWMAGQAAHDLAVTERKIGKRIRRAVKALPPSGAGAE